MAILVLGVLAAVLLVVFKKVGGATVTVWGLWEEPGVMADVIADFQKKSPNVKINYLKQSTINYRDRLQTAITGASGPDVFLIHNSWLPMMKNFLEPMPTSVYSPTEYRTIFYPVASRDLILGGKAFAVPLEIDSLALFVNQDILAAAGVTVPTTWDGTDSFVTAAQKMTVRDGNGRIQASGAALGTASNIDHWQDIVALMMLQAGVDITTEATSTKAQEALLFYTSFATGDRTWDETLDSSTVAFAAGKVGMYFGPSWRFFDLKAINPNLNFKVVPVPQLTGADPVNLATYWAMTVSKKSKSTKAAWDFIKFLSSKEELTKMYSTAAKTRAFGEPYGRTDMANLLLNDPNVAPFISAGQTARSSYLASFTADGETGINSRISKYYRDAINAILRGGDSKTALETVGSGVAQILSDYK